MGVPRLMQAVLAASVAAMCLLTFVWPLAVSADPADSAFQVAAIATFTVFLVALALRLAARLAQRR